MACFHLQYTERLRSGFTFKIKKKTLLCLPFVCCRKVMQSRDKVNEQLAHYLQLKNVIELLQSNNMTSEPLKMQVDLGCNFYVQAKV